MSTQLTWRTARYIQRSDCVSKRFVGCVLRRRVVAVEDITLVQDMMALGYTWLSAQTGVKMRGKHPKIIQ